MGCGISTTSGSAKHPAAEGVLPHLKYAEADRSTGEFDELSIRDMTTASFWQSNPIAPYAFQRPRAVKNYRSPVVPCLEDEQLTGLPNESIWAQRRKRRQLYKEVHQDKKGRVYVFFNDSLDLVFTVKFTFSPEVVGSAEKISILDTLAVTRRVQSEEFVVFDVRVEPLSTVEALLIPVAVPDDHFLVVYDPEPVCSSKFKENAFNIALQRWEMDRKSLADVLEAAWKDKERRQRLWGDALFENISDDATAQLCIDENVLFVDDSIKGVRLHKNDIIAAWLRPVSIFLPIEEREVRLFRSPVGCRPRLRQGPLASRALFLALSALADDMLTIRELFRHPRDPAKGREERKVGAFRVTLFVKGTWTHYLTDNFLPVSGGLFLGVSSHDPCELWPQVLEKALAKAVGGYSMLEFLSFSDVIEMCTGTCFGTVSRGWRRCGQQGNRNNAVKMFYMISQLLEGGHTVVLQASADSETSLYRCVVTSVREASDEGDDYGFVVRELEPADDSETLEDKFKTIDLSDIDTMFCGAGIIYRTQGFSTYSVHGVFRQGIPSVAVEISPTSSVRALISLHGTGLFAESDEAHLLISVAKCTDGAANRVTPLMQRGNFELVANSALDMTEAQSHSLSYRRHSCVIQPTLHPRDAPFLIVPRWLASDDYEQTIAVRPGGARGDMKTNSQFKNEVPFTMTVALQGAAVDRTHARTQVQFKRIDKDCRIFHNSSTFFAGNAGLQSTEANYSVRTFGLIEGGFDCYPR